MMPWSLRLHTVGMLLVLTECVKLLHGTQASPWPMTGLKARQCAWIRYVGSTRTAECMRMHMPGTEQVLA